MGKDKSDLLFVTYDHLRVENPVEAEIMVEYFPEAFTKKFSSVNTRSNPKMICSETDDFAFAVESEDDI